ncbi:MAG: M48 family metalloprotease, partial [Pseudomonadota bacterium]
EAEAAADVFALEMLDASGTDAGGMADFFDKIAELQASDSGRAMPQFLATHPDSHARAHAARNFAAAQGYGTTPILSAREWEAFRNICKD